MATFTFSTTAEEDAALAALGRDFESTVRAHLAVLITNHQDLRFEAIKNAVKSDPALLDKIESAPDVAEAVALKV